MVTIILLAGGESRRLWPFSEGEEAKQFLPLFDGESMLQRTYRRIASQPFVKEVLVTTGWDQMTAVKRQLPSALTLGEPSHQGTYAALLLALAFLKEERALERGDLVGLIPTDSEVGGDYFKTIGEMVHRVEEGVVLLGIEPREAASRFGYILPGPSNRVARFVEKPSQREAESLIAQGAYWNSGVALFRLGDLPLKPYKELLEGYTSLSTLSFDQAVLEKQDYPLFVYPYRGTWDDLGSWPSLLKVVGATKIGPYTLEGEGTNTTILNLTNTPLTLVEPQELLVAVSSKGALVAPKGHLND